MKKLIFIFTALLLTINALGAEIANGTCGDNVTWSLSDEGVLTISGSGSMCDASYQIIDGKYVTKNSYGTYYSSIKSVVIDDGVTSIGQYAFRGFSSLTSVILPSSVTSIGISAFNSCSGLTSVAIPNSVTSIGKYAFDGCSNLKSITIPNSVTSIGISTFKDCSSLSSIKVDANNKKYDSRNNCNAIIETSTNTLIVGCSKTIIPSSVTSIGQNAFDGCSNLKSITLPSSLTSIGNSAFFCCISLSYISIPSSVTSIGSDVFAGCSSLKSITLPSSLTSIGDATFYRCYNLMTVTIPSSVTSIGDVAFYGCYNLSSITIPSSVTSIGGSAFGGCYVLQDNLTNGSKFDLTNYGLEFADIEQKDGLVIKDNIVVCCRKYATSVTIPSSVTSIRSSAFRDCSSLKSISIPSSVTSIGGGAFDYCDNLSKVIIYASDIPKTVGSIFSYSNIASATLYVPKSSIEEYKATSPWSEFGAILPVEDYHTEITKYDNIVYVNDITTLQGTQATLSVQLKNNDAVYGYEFELTLPEGVTVATTTDSFGDTYPEVSLTEERTNSNRHTLSSSMSGNKLKVLCYSDKKNAFIDNEGEVAQIKINIPEGYTAGEYPIKLTNEAISLDGTTPVIDKVITTLTVVAGKHGDANGDNLINVGDITSIAGYILGEAESNFNIYAADANDDGNVNVGDITTIAGMILDGTANAAKGKTPATALNGYLSLPQLSMAAGSEIIVPIYETTVSGAFSSYQFDVNVPEGFEIADIVANSIRSSRLDNFSYTKLSDTTYRVLAYSVTNASVADTYGALAYITLRANSDVAEGNYQLSVSNAVLANKSTTHSVANVATTIAVGSASGISTMNTPVNADAMYDISGRKVKNIGDAPRGIYIINGKKIVR